MLMLCNMLVQEVFLHPLLSFDRGSIFDPKNNILEFVSNSRFQQLLWQLPLQISYTILQNKRMRRCGVAPPPIIFERLKLPQQIIYRRKENLSESPNHQKYWENILVSRFYKQFSRNRRNLGHFRKFEKISDS